VSRDYTQREKEKESKTTHFFSCASRRIFFFFFCFEAPGANQKFRLPNIHYEASVWKTQTSPKFFLCHLAQHPRPKCQFRKWWLSLHADICAVWKFISCMFNFILWFARQCFFFFYRFYRWEFITDEVFDQLVEK
jgi:hypothetical protein